MTTNKNFTLAEMKQAQTEKDFHFFSKGSMAFFKSKIIESTVNENHFITSEKFDDNSDRKYTIRKFDPIGYQVDTIGEFQGYDTLKKAKTALKNILKEGK